MERAPGEGAPVRGAVWVRAVEEKVAERVAGGPVAAGAPVQVEERGAMAAVAAQDEAVEVVAVAEVGEPAVGAARERAESASAPSAALSYRIDQAGRAPMRNVRSADRPW